MPGRLALLASAATVAVLGLSGCGTTTSGMSGPGLRPPASTASAPASVAPTTTAAPSSAPSSKTQTTIPSAGNPAGRATVPAEAKAEDTSKPTLVIGDGTRDSCSSQRVVDAVAAGGVITFSCGPDPLTITMGTTARVRNGSPKVVLDGGGKITLSGGAKRRILYMNTCDVEQGITTSHCQDQETPKLTVQNLSFVDGNSTAETTEGGGGGAIFVRGGRVKVVNSRFIRNRCDQSGPDLGGAALRVLSQSKGQPVYIVSSTFEGGSCSNGGALSSIGVSWIVLNSLLHHNSAVGRGANPARPGTPGGGSGGAIYTDGNKFTVRIAGSLVESNHAAEGGGAVFFVSNDRTGTMSIEGSTLRSNPSDGFETKGFRGIFFLGANKPTVSGSTIQ